MRCAMAGTTCWCCEMVVLVLLLATVLESPSFGPASFIMSEVGQPTGPRLLWSAIAGQVGGLGSFHRESWLDWGRLCTAVHGHATRAPSAAAACEGGHLRIPSKREGKMQRAAVWCQSTVMARAGRLGRPLSRENNDKTRHTKAVVLETQHGVLDLLCVCFGGADPKRQKGKAKTRPAFDSPGQCNPGRCKVEPFCRHGGVGLRYGGRGGQVLLRLGSWLFLQSAASPHQGPPTSRSGSYLAYASGVVAGRLLQVEIWKLAGATSNHQ